MFVYNNKYVSKKEGHYYSCPWIEYGIVFFQHKISTCCHCGHSGGGHSLIRNNYAGHKIDWNRIFEIKEMYRRFHKKGKICTTCMDCPFLQEGKWEREYNYIDRVYISNWSNCNARCIYCYSTKHPEEFTYKQVYSVLPLIKDLYEKGILSTQADIAFGGGEPTLQAEFEELIQFFTEKIFKRVRVHTSGIKYSAALAEAINALLAYVVVSVDAGSPEVYEKIKQVPAYEKVRENIRKYSLQTTYIGRYLVSAKYIIIPGINDTIEEVEKWLQANDEAGLYTTVLDIEENWHLENGDKIPAHIFDLIKYVEKRSKQLGTHFEMYERLQNMFNKEENRRKANRSILSAAKIEKFYK